MKGPEMMQSSEKQQRNFPKIISFAPHPVDQDVLGFQKEMYVLRDLYDCVNRAGKTIGEDNLSMKVLVTFINILVYFGKPIVRDSIHPVPPIDFSHKAHKEETQNE